MADPIGGVAWIGSVQGVVASWTDMQVVATVDSNAVSGIVRIQQNGIWSNALSFKVPPSLSTAPSVNINPNLASMVVGETRSLQALDDNGNVLAGLTWTSTDPPYTLLKPVDFFIPPVLVHTDGTVLTVDGDTVVGIDPLTGNPKFNIQLENTIFSSNGNCGEFTPSEFSAPPSFGQPIIAGDGFAYFPYDYEESPLASNGKVCYSIQNPQDGDVLEAFFIHQTAHLRVLRVATDGSYSKIVLGDWTFDHVHQCVYVNSPGNLSGECGHTRDVVFSSGGIPVFFGQLRTLITNADQGAFFSWDLDFNNGSSPAHQLTTISGSTASTISLPVPGSFQPMLQGADGTLFGTVSLPPDPSGNPGSSFMIALDPSQNPKWTAPNLSPKYLTDDGSVIAQSADGTMAATLNQNGSVTGQTADLGAVSSWMENWYLDPTVSLASIALSALLPARSFAAVAGGNPSGNGTADITVMWDVREKIGEIAQSKLGSQNWLDIPPPAPGLPGQNKCNIFVHDIIKLAGQTPPESDKGSFKHRLGYYLGQVDSKNYPAQAGDWADANRTLGCWKTLTLGPPALGGPNPLLPPDISGPGDVIAEAIQYSDATGHVGIVVGPHQMASADSAINCYDPTHPPAGTITITDYGFRPDNYLDPTGCRSHGLEIHAVVKQFVCF